MKWLFLVNNASCFPEFFAKLTGQVVEHQDECLVAMNSKFVEFEKKEFFPAKAQFISKVDWCLKNYKKDKKDFGNLAWKDLFPIFERYAPKGFFNYENSFNIMSQAYQFFEFIFQQEKPDIVISEVPSGLFHETAFYFCKKNGVPFIGLGGSIFDNRINVYDSEFTFSKYEKTFEELSESNISEEEKKFAKNFTEKLISHKYTPSYLDIFYGLVKIYSTHFEIIKHYIKRIKESGFLFLKLFMERKYFKGFDYETEIQLRYSINIPWRLEKRRFRMFFEKNVFSKINDSDKNFFFFPLHYQPEASTAVWATYYSDQLATIKNIAFALPFPYKLYVKEHPGAVGLRQKSFYRKLQELPNVVLISPYENIEQVIKKSLAVVALTSTAGLEAALSGKRVYVLGNVFYSYHPLCKKVNNFQELKDMIEKDLTNNKNIDNLEDINCRFITSYFRNTIEGSIISASLGEDINDYKLIYQKLKPYAISKTA